MSIKGTCKLSATVLTASGYKPCVSVNTPFLKLLLVMGVSKTGMAFLLLASVIKRERFVL